MWDYKFTLIVLTVLQQQQTYEDLPSLLSDMASAAFLPFLLQSSKSGPEQSQIIDLNNKPLGRSGV